MSSSKHIDIICIAATVLALLITVLFMNGEKLGIMPITNGDEESGMFTANDINAEWDSSNATQIMLTGDGGSVNGDGAYMMDGDVHIAFAGKYVISGELTDGSVIVDANANDKIWILLNGVSIHCSESAAIIVEQADKVFLTVANETENFISTGEEYADSATSLGIDGAIYSKDDLTINGSGSLIVTAEYKHGVVCNDDLVIVGADIEITAAQDGIHANDSARFSEVSITISAGDDGITVSNDDETAFIYVESGSITITECYEGLEAIDVTIAGGVINITSTDDGINANGRGSNSVIRITGGDITILNPTGRDADGLDSNGDIYIESGRLFISVIGDGANCAIDYGSESGGVCEINGGTVIAAGGATMLEAPASSSAQGFIMYNSSTASAETDLTLQNSSGTTLLSEKIPYSFSSAIISTPELKIGDTCILTVGNEQEEITVDNFVNTGGFGMGGKYAGGDDQGRPNGGETPFGFGSESGDATMGNLPQEGPPELPNGNQQNFPEMPEGNFGGGGMPGGEAPNGQMPNGGMPGGEAPNGQMPNGGMPDGEAPNGQMPNGGMTGGKAPNDQVPNGGVPGGEAQNDQVSNGEMPGGEAPNAPMPNGEMPEERAPNESSNISTGTLILIFVSAVILLAGIIIALKVRG